MANTNYEEHRAAFERMARQEEKEKILRKMEEIEEQAPLSMEHAEDGRYAWPERWKNLKWWLIEIHKEL